MGQVKTGLEVLASSGFKPLAGKRVGLITNPTGIDAKYRKNIDILFASKSLKLVALFGPEHGVRGAARAGEEVGNATDAETGLPEFSLYGKTSKPTPEMLKNIDALVFDIQDIGSRSYTYITTLGKCMEAAAENHVPLYVLDRPNPIGGNLVEGNITRAEFKSTVSPYPIPYCHGLTVGELAQMINGEGWLKNKAKCELHVIKMTGWKRSMEWSECGLPWVLTSPHVPKPESAHFYAITGIVGELDALSIGVGYTLPFELAGAPGLDPAKFAAELNRRNLPGVLFRPLVFVPYYAIFKGQSLGGVQIHLTDPKKVELTRLNFELMDAARKLQPGISFFGRDRDRMFDLVCGTDEVRKMFLAGKSAADIWTVWNKESSGFKVARQKYLLYP